MEYLNLIKPYLHIITFASLAVSVVAGFAGDVMGQGFTFRNRRPRPDTPLGRWLLGIERVGLAICLTSITAMFGFSLLVP